MNNTKDGSLERAIKLINCQSDCLGKKNKKERSQKSQYEETVVQVLQVLKR